jgi:hypothetical protein
MMAIILSPAFGCQFILASYPLDRRLNEHRYFQAMAAFPRKCLALASPSRAAPRQDA